MRKLVHILAFFLTILFLITPVYAQWEYDINWLWTELFGLPEEWMQVPAIIYNFIIPFIAIFVICLGFLRVIRIFENVPNVEYVLAFCMAFSTLPVHAFVTIVSWTLGIMGGLSYVVFFILFILGLFFYLITRYKLWRVGTGEVDVRKAYIQATKDLLSQASHIRQQRASLNTRKRGLIRKLAHVAPNSTDSDNIHNEIAKIDKRLAELEMMEDSLAERRRELKQSI